jgi:predicted site-specific integrase-resolvase
MTIETRELVAPIHAAQRIGICRRRLNYMVKEGKLHAIVDSSGHRTFRVEDIEKELKRREARKAKK